MNDRGSDLLAAIVAATRRIVAVRRDQVPRSEMERRAAQRVPDAVAFRAAVARTDRLNVIAECKRRSPSRGVLRREYEPSEIAVAYEAAGAAAISVLTEPTFFDGALGHLEEVRRAVRLPLLRKDFVVDGYQLLEARACGADAVLLIVAALTTAELTRLAVEADALGLATLVEVHSQEELARAVDAGARVIGVNNRDLRSLAVNLEASARLIDGIPDGVTGVAESGLKRHEDLVALRAAGYDAFLVGERLVSEPDPGRAFAELIGGLA